MISDPDDVPIAGHIEHHVEHEPLEQAAQGAGAGALFDGLGRQFPQGLRGEVQLDSFHGQELGILLGQRVLRLGQDRHQLVLVELVQHRDNGQSADELGDEPVPSGAAGIKHLCFCAERYAGCFLTHAASCAGYFINGFPLHGERGNKGGDLGRRSFAVHYFLECVHHFGF